MMIRITTRCFFLMLAIRTVAVPAGAVPAPAPPIEEWIAQLGDPDDAQRNQARRKLLILGEPALAKVRQAAKDNPRPAVRQQAAELVESIERGEILAIGPPNSGYWLNRIAFIPDDRHILVAGGGLIEMDLLEAKETRRDLELPFARLGLAVSPDGKRFATGHDSEMDVRIGDIKSFKVTHTLEGHKGGVQAVAFSPSGEQLVSGGLDGTLRLWDLKTSKEIKQFPGIKDFIRCTAFSPDGKQILSGHFGRKSEFSVCLWDVATGKEVRTLNGHMNEVTGVFFLPDGKTALSTGMDGRIISWQLEGSKQIRRFNHDGGISNAALSADGKRLLTAGNRDQAVRLWDVESGKEIKKFMGHNCTVLGVAISKDGRLAVSCDNRTFVRLWRLPK